MALEGRGENAKRGRWRASVRGKGECEVDREEVERKVGCGEGRQRGKVREGDRTWRDGSVKVMVRGKIRGMGER